MMNEEGWDIDEDDLDFSDNEENEQEPPVRGGNNIQLGQGLLFGGLSRFIEAVTQPDNNEDSLGLEDDDDGDENAWEEDEDDLDALVANDITENNNTAGHEQQQDNVMPTMPPQGHYQPLLLPINVPPTPPVGLPPQNVPQDGWDLDDKDLEKDTSLHEESQLQQTSGWDDTLEGLEDSLPSHPQPSSLNDSGGGGWDDTLEGLDDDSLEAETPAEEPSTQPVPPAQQAESGGGGWDDESLEGLDDVEEEQPQNTSDGWQENDVDLDNIELNDNGIETTAQERVIVDHVPASTAAVTTAASESIMTNGDESTVVRENALDEQGQFMDPSQDYGPVVDHLPTEHTTTQEEEQQTDDARTNISLVPDSVVDEMSLEEQDGKLSARAKADPNAIIDHVPDDVSNVAPMSNTDSTASVDGDEPSEMPRQEENEKFGPIVDRMPSEQNLPLTPRAGSSAHKIAPSSFVESLEEKSDLQFPTEQEVDHVPESITDVAANKSDDSTASVYGDEAQDMAKDEALSEPPIPEPPMEVDHVPDDVSNVSTSNNDSTASVDGEPTEMPDEEMPDESADEAQFGPVVDRMPSLHPELQHDRTVSTIAPSTINNDELDEMDKTKGSTDDNVSDQAVASGMRSPPGVVDHVPTDASKSTSRSKTLAGATTMSVASELSNTLGDEALESDVDAREENYGPVVDHTPLQQSIHSRRNPSVRVQAPIEEMDEETDDEEQYFGPVVDHTPTVQVSTVSSVTGSMAVAAPPSEVDEDSSDDDDSSDEQSGGVEREGQESDFCDDDTLDAPTAVSLVSASRYGPALVDHVPNRPGTRPTDASTLVVVDPSEVSTVGDMTYEEQQYGPVVDHLPSAHPPPQASAAGSTVVAATASVGPDDTLVDDDDDGRPRDENESDDGATLPTLDNPPPMEANVVDHVPEERPRDFRFDSVLTTAPTQSVLSPDETRDSEFGLVVDHLPTNLLPGPPSRGSLAVLAPESELDVDTESGIVEQEVTTPAGEQPASERTTEEAKVVVDILPPARENRSIRAADSTVTVRSHVSDDDTLEAIARPDRFGPVVDQLPASGVSVQRSLGGSTTGALATLSEVNDDTIVDEDVQGWDYDEQELDSVQGVDGRQSRPRPASRGLSVTFSHTVHGLDDNGEGNSALFASLADETQYFDAESGDTPAKSVNETQYFDSETGDAANGETASLHMNGDARSRPAAQCTSCDEAQGSECPCVQRILRAETNDNDMVLSVRTPEGVLVEIDVKKLLQDETTKRLLLEKEVEALRSTIESLQTIASHNEAESAEEKKVTEEFRASADTLTRELDLARGERDVLERQKQDLATQLAASRNEVANHARDTEALVTQESELRAEIAELQRSRDETRSEAQQLAAMNDQLASEVDQMRNANEELLLELDSRKRDWEELEAKNKGLLDDCAAKESMLSELAQERSDLSSRQSALEDETLQLRRALEESSLAATSESDLRNQLSSLQIEAATKSGECEELRSQLDQTQRKLQESEGRSFAQMKESTRLKRIHDGEVQKLQEQIQSLEQAQRDVVGEHEAAVLHLNNRLSQVDAEMQAMISENESLKSTVNETRKKYEAQVRQEQSSLQSQSSQLRALETKLSILEAEKAKSSQDLSSLRLQLQNAMERSHAATALQSEYDSLQETLAVNKETIQSLQEQVEVLSQANKTGTDQMEALVNSISSERDDLRRALQSRDSEMEALRSDLQAQADENRSIENRMEALATKCGEMEAFIEDLQSNTTKLEHELAEKDHLYQSLKESHDADATSHVREQYERELQNLNQLVSERDQSLQSLQTQLETQMSTIRERDDVLSELELQRTEAVKRIETLSLDRENSLSRIGELEEELARTREQYMKLEESSSNPSARERELQENLEALISERDDALKQREMLEEDSEELLVQLGLMKEQLDVREREVEEMHQIISEKEVAMKLAEERLREAEGYIGELSRTEEEPMLNGDHDSKAEKLVELQRTVDELTLAKEDLRQQIDDLSSTNAYVDAQVTSLRDEKVELLGRLQEMERRQHVSGTDAVAREQQHQSRVNELEEQCRHLDEVCRQKDEELERMTSRLHEAQASSAASLANVGSLQQRVAQLENACSEQGQVLHDRDRALEDMMLELEGLRSRAAAEPNATDHPDSDMDLDSLRNRLLHAERSAQHYQERMREMEAVLEQARRDLKHKTEKLSETESALFDKELELDLQQQDKGEEGEMRKQLHEMEALLAQRNHEIQDAFERERSMEKTLAELQASIGIAHSSVTENGPSSNAVEEPRQLRAQLASLRQQLESSSSEKNEREEVARREVVTLNETIKSKMEQIASLEAQLQSLSTEFSSSQAQLVSKEADYRRLSLELEETRGDQLQSTRTVTSQVLESTSREEAESVEAMRSHIISLAQALEQSETQRADAIERLLNERKASADSLRRLGESVKRFYSSLSYRDG